MRAKNVLLVALVLVNLVLLTALMLNVTATKAAYAQAPRGGGNDYVVVTGKLAQGNEDALWMLDLRNRKLYAFRLPQGAGAGAVQNMVQIGVGRDLLRDLRNERPK